MKKHLSILIVSLVVSLGLIPVASQATTMAIDQFENTTNSGAIFSVPIPHGGLAMINYSAGDNNSERYIKLFVNYAGFGKWQELTKHDITATPATVLDLKRFSDKMYVLLSVGVNGQNIELWEGNINAASVWKKISTIDGGYYGKAVLTRYQGKIQVYSSNVDNTLSHWMLKKDVLQEQSVTTPYTNESIVLPIAITPFKNTLNIVLQVNNDYQLVTSTDGKLFTTASSFPAAQDNEVFTVLAKSNKQLLLGTTNSTATTVWATADLATWNKTGSFAWTDTKSYDVDVLAKNGAKPVLLLTEYNSANLANLSTALYQYTDSTWNKAMAWEQVGRGNTVLHLNHKFQVLLNTNNGSEAVTVKF
ncbi:MAG: hypothetical protein WCW27_00610 [Patescibacteria group bacterium]|jgi:hypothetical protein